MRSNLPVDLGEKVVEEKAVSRDDLFRNRQAENQNQAGERKKEVKGGVGMTAKECGESMMYSVRIPRPPGQNSYDASTIEPGRDEKSRTAYIPSSSRLRSTSPPHSSFSSSGSAAWARFQNTNGYNHRESHIQCRVTKPHEVNISYVFGIPPAPVLNSLPPLPHYR